MRDFWFEVRSYVFDSLYCSADGRPLPPDRAPWLLPAVRVWLAALAAAAGLRVPARLD
jgi:hypothetical protein